MSDEMMRCGFVAIVGRPNVGKSTLLNALVGEKLSIVSAKPHTTRHRVLGVMNRPGLQAVFIDTPGHTRRSARALHRLMARACRQAVEDADLILLLVEADGLKSDDHRLFEVLGDLRERTVLVVNKIDSIRSRQSLLPFLDELAQHGFADYVPVSALRSENLDRLVDVLKERLPESGPLFPSEFRTDKDVNFRAAEIIREKLFEALHQEVPYGLTVEIESVEPADDDRLVVGGLIWVDRESHKPIVIGKGGRVLKEVGSAARPEISALMEARVHLNLWLKVREHWSDSERELRRLGFDEA